MSIIYTIKDNDWNSVRQAIQKLASTKLGAVATPTFTGMNLVTLSVASATVSSLAVTSATFGDAYVTAPNQIYLLDHDSFAGFVADEHIPHSGVVITANAPLSGGGTISVSRTFSLAYTSTLAVSTGALHVLATVLAHDSLDAVHQSVTTTASPVFANVFISAQATFGSPNLTPPSPANAYTVYIPSPTGLAYERVEEDIGAQTNTFLKSRGTYGARTAILSSDQLAHINALGYRGTEVTTGAYVSVASGDIYLLASEAFTSLVAGAYWQVQAIITGTLVRATIMEMRATKVNLYQTTHLGDGSSAYSAFSTTGDFTAAGSAVISARFFSVATATITALENNQMTISQTTLGLTINIQGNDGIWRTGTVALVS